jgi:hypothetical protein
MAKEAKSVYIDGDLWEQAKQKAGGPRTDRSLSYVVSHLLKLWLLGKIEVDPRQLIGQVNGDN